MSSDDPRVNALSPYFDTSCTEVPSMSADDVSATGRLALVSTTAIYEEIVADTIRPGLRSRRRGV
jgi:hypothetical protein